MPTPPDKKLLPALAVLTGNPNCGKTTLFNALTGLRAKVGNYAGVTVERKEGRMLGDPSACPVTILDLPGTYSLSPQSLDEQIARDVLFSRLADVGHPDVVVLVVDASNLERNLYYATQVIELGYPTILAVNMLDVAKSHGMEIDLNRLARELGVVVVPLVASEKQGIRELRERIIELASQPDGAVQPGLFCDLPPFFTNEMDRLAADLRELVSARTVHPRSEALLLLGDEGVLSATNAHYTPAMRERVLKSRQRLDMAGIAWGTVTIEGRYHRVAAICSRVVRNTKEYQPTFSDRLDRVLTHPVWGLVVFAAVMALMFQSIFTFAKWPMEMLDLAVNWFGGHVGRIIPPGDLHDLVVEGALAGAGAVVVFLPQICLLFLFIGLLEDTGYMARAAFIMDRIMSKVGLHGKSFIPMLSSFACAIPGLMATRTIESPKDRLATILVSPLMSCSARLPVYTLLIATCIPNSRVLGVFKLPGLVMLSMYSLGIVMALVMAWLFKRTLLKGEPSLLIMELPPYKRPSFRLVLRHVWERARLFLKKAGTVILGINILLWFLATYPRDTVREQHYEQQRAIVASAHYDQAGEREAALAVMDRQAAAERLQRSFAGMMGRVIEPAIAPLGFDWKMGIGIVASFAAREVFVSTMSTVYAVSGDAGNATESLAQSLRAQLRPDGTPVYSTLTCLTLMVFYVFALQCVSTIAVVRRETNSWRWPLFQWFYMGVLAWVFAMLTRIIGHWLGYS